MERIAKRDLELKLPRGLKPKLSKDGELLLRALLHRDATVRLGSDRDAAAVKEHNFFQMVDFDLLLARRVEPPFVPKNFVADLKPGEDVAWDDVKPDPARAAEGPPKLDIADRRFNEIFARFEFRHDADEAAATR